MRASGIHLQYGSVLNKYGRLHVWLRVVVSLVLPGLSPVRRLRTALMAAPGGVESRDERRTRSGSTYGLGIMSSIRRITSHNTEAAHGGQ